MSLWAKAYACAKYEVDQWQDDLHNHKIHTYYVLVVKYTFT